MKKYGEGDVKLQRFLISALDWGEWSAWDSNCFTLGKIPLPITSRQEDGWVRESVLMW